MTDLDEALNSVKTEIASHWASCADAGLPHTPSNRDRVVTSLEAYVAELKGLGNGHGDGPVIDAMRHVYAALDAINADHDEGLLETDERELIVPFLVEAAECAGVESDAYDGEPGGEFRNF